MNRSVHFFVIFNNEEFYTNMNINDIHVEWNKDSIINELKLGSEAIRIVKLHSKYLEFYTKEKLLLLKYELEQRILRKEKFEFYLEGPTSFTQEKGWVLPPKGKIFRSDIQLYIDADADIINMNLKIGLQQEKVDLLEKIIKFINTMGFQIKAAIEFTKWTAGY